MGHKKPFKVVALDGETYHVTQTDAGFSYVAGSAGKIYSFRRRNADLAIQIWHSNFIYLFGLLFSVPILFSMINGFSFPESFFGMILGLPFLYSLIFKSPPKIDRQKKSEVTTKSNIVLFLSLHPETSKAMLPVVRGSISGEKSSLYQNVKYFAAAAKAVKAADKVGGEIGRNAVKMVTEILYENPDKDHELTATATFEDLHKSLTKLSKENEVLGKSVDSTATKLNELQNFAETMKTLADDSEKIIEFRTKYLKQLGKDS